VNQDIAAGQGLRSFRVLELMAAPENGNAQPRLPYKHFVKQLLGVGAYLSGAFYAGFTPVLTFLCAAGTPLVSAA